MLTVQIPFIPFKAIQMVGLLSHVLGAVTSLARKFTSNMGPRQACLWCLRCSTLKWLMMLP